MEDSPIKKKIITTEILEDVVNKTTADKISIVDLVSAMDAGGFGLVMTIFSLPIIIPLPPPFPSFIAVPMALFSFQMMIGCKLPKLPKMLSNISVKRSILAMMVEKSSPYIKKAESFVKPRLKALSSSWFRKVIGFFCFIFSFSVLLPLPLSNFLPGMGVLITAFGLLGGDGAIIILGLFVGCLGILITAIAVFLGVEAFSMIKDFALNWFL